MKRDIRINPQGAEIDTLCRARPRPTTIGAYTIYGAHGMGTVKERKMNPENILMIRQTRGLSEHMSFRRAIIVLIENTKNIRRRIA